MVKYQNRDLIAIVRNLSEGRRVYSKLRVATTWEALSNEVHRFQLEDTEKESRIKQGFAVAWARFAHDFLDRDASREYNSIKHGLRARPGGFAISLGIEHEYGVAPPAAEMSPPQGSLFGSSFYVPESIDGQRLVFRPRTLSRNWVPESFIAGMLLLSICIGNLLSFLRAFGGEKESTLQFSWPEDLAGLEAPWSYSVGCISMGGLEYETRPEDIPDCTREEVFQEYTLSIKDK
jgi:hypothetical protein